MKNFNKWLDTFIEEKGYDLEQVFEVDGPSGWNMIPLSSPSVCLHRYADSHARLYCALCHSVTSIPAASQNAATASDSDSVSITVTGPLR